MNQVKFKTLAIGQRFSFGECGESLIKLADTLYGAINEAGAVVETNKVGRNERVWPKPAQRVARPTEIAAASTYHIHRVERAAMVKRWSEAQASMGKGHTA